MPALQLDVLGGFTARTAEGEEIALATRKARALLAYLALNPERAQARSSLQWLLWGDRGEEQARGSLRYALTDIRRAFGAHRGILVTEADRIRLRAGEVATDAAAFERLARSPDPIGLRQAVSLYRGELLAGLEVRAEPFAEWLAMERERLRGLAIQALVALLAREPDADLAHRLLALDPLNEAAHRSLMQFYASHGQWTLAVRQYEGCRDALRRELDVMPEPATCRLCEDILNRRRRPEQPARAPMTRTVTGDRPGVRVQPFAAVGDAGAAPALAMALAAAVATELARFREVTVFTDEGAQFRVEGTVHGLGARVRVLARLVEVASGIQVWAERYDRSADDPFALEDELAGTMALTVAARLAMLVQERAQHKPPGDLRAYECFVQGNRCIDRDAEGRERARAWFAQALAIDPSFARAHAGLVFVHLLRAFADCIGLPRSETFDEALGHAEMAVYLDPADARVHYALATVCLQRRDFERARRHFDRAADLNPNDATVRLMRGYGLACLGEVEAGQANVEAALRLNPTPPEWYFSYRARVLLLARRPAESAAQMRCLPQLAGPRNLGWLVAADAHAGAMEAADTHAAAFLAAMAAAWRGAAGAGPAEFVAWFLDASPLAREEDREYLRQGLRRAGLPA